MSAYYARLSRIAMRNHGLNSEHHAQLARWAQYAAAHSYTNRGVLVTGDGRLHAETIRPPRPTPDPLARQTERPPVPPWQINAHTWRGPGEAPAPPGAISEALDIIKAATGLPVAHVLAWEVCTGWAGSDVEQNPSP
ncbi:hypothetical protein GCM10007061_24680 [Kocuria marina]|nr:hypothetical protein GCM10007061_24680 [Kocuria marina]